MDVQLTLEGSGFVPATVLDPSSGRRTVTLEGFHARIGIGTPTIELTRLAWLSTERITALLTKESALALPVGPLNVELLDPRGSTALLLNAFEELGHDDVAPTLTFTAPAPDTPFAASMPLHGSFHASDAPSGVLSALSWEYWEPPNTLIASDTCDAPGDVAEADCSFQVTISAKLQAGARIDIVAYARDAAGDAPNSTQLTRSFWLKAKPTISSVSPSNGGTAGGTDVLIKGTGFLPGSQASLGDVLIFPNGGTVVDESTISGYAPAHAAAWVSLKVHGPVGDVVKPLAFQYQNRSTVDAGVADSGAPRAEVSP
jgi:hypothetical protein